MTIQLKVGNYYSAHCVWVCSENKPTVCLHPSEAGLGKRLLISFFWFNAFVSSFMQTSRLAKSLDLAGSVFASVDICLEITQCGSIEPGNKKWTNQEARVDR